MSDNIEGFKLIFESRLLGYAIKKKITLSLVGINDGQKSSITHFVEDLAVNECLL